MTIDQINAFIHWIIEKWPWVIVPNVPVNNWTNLMNLIFDFPNMIEKPWISKQEKSIRLFSSQCMKALI
jgi:hypothetical protein